MNAGKDMRQTYSTPATTRLRVSVLMSTYKAETGPNLAAALESLEAQSILPDEMVLVIDGPIGSDQDDVIAAFVARAVIPTRLVRLPVNGGLAEAMNAGLDHCDGNLIMRMDSDDICTRDRLETQLAYAENHPDIDVIASWSEEFFEDGARSQLKVTPTSHDAIVRALRWRNVVHHPTLLIKKNVLTRIGGYRALFGFLEDYDLFVRLILSGAKFHAIPKVLIRIRSSSAQRARRGGFRYLVNDVRFRMQCLQSGFLTKSEFVAVTLMYSVFRLVSGPVRRRVYALARI
jgi:glycosyltransferase involved in cell wall biosynthesis